MVEYNKLTEHTGAEILGVDLNQQIPQSTIQEIWNIFVDHCVVLFRGQKLDQADLVRATSQFGECGEYDRPAAFHTSGQKKVLPQIMLITNIRENGEPIGSLPDGEMWFHHDTIHRKIPHKATLLYSVEVPKWGGQTVFSNLMAAYDALPDDLRQALEGRQAYNAFNYGATKKGDPNATAARSYAVHPAIRTCPDNGRKAIYLDRLMSQHLVDVPEAESEAILNRIYDFIERPEFCYEHEWRKGDVLMWDNRTSIHARRDFPADQVRLMWRTTLADTVAPYCAA
ncbi:MAG: TauD/TfdA dioxygenase family protein [Xanthobacteraceae bacterium]|jgi:taurine dioxygenase